MAPEQLQAKGVERRTDIFAAGIVLWEALTGRRLFDAEEASEVLRMILSEEIPPPSAVVPSIPRNVDETVMKALIRDPSKRYQTAREFAIALEDAMHLASPREIGEWVEKVAGDTLLRREQTLAEIEAVSDISLLTDSAAGFLKTFNDVAPQLKESQKVPDEVSQWDEGPTKIFDPSRGKDDDEATRMDSLAAHRATVDRAPPARTGGTRRGIPAPAHLPAKPAAHKGAPTTRLGLGTAKPAVNGIAPPKPAGAAKPSTPPRPSGASRSGGPPPAAGEPSRRPRPRPSAHSMTRTRRLTSSTRTDMRWATERERMTRPREFSTRIDPANRTKRRTFSIKASMRRAKFPSARARRRSASAFRKLRLYRALKSRLYQSLLRSLPRLFRSGRVRKRSGSNGVLTAPRRLRRKP
jgi:serine/threonine-protein kinase